MRLHAAFGDGSDTGSKRRGASASANTGHATPRSTMEGRNNRDDGVGRWKGRTMLLTPTVLLAMCIGRAQSEAVLPSECTVYGARFEP
jgi:hypothetical protein